MAQTWKDIVQNYIIKYSDKIKKTTKPLKERFGITYFTYHRVTNQGDYTVLVDRPDWAEHYVTNKYYLIDPYLSHPDNLPNGLSFIAKSAIDALNEVVAAENAIMLIDKQPEYADIYGFSGKNGALLNELALNHSTLLYSFASHFTQKLKPELQKMRLESPSLIALKGKSAFLKPGGLGHLKESERQAFLQELGHKNPNLSKRQQQCLKLLLAGNSAKETALHMGIKQKTVEAYLETTKDKLHCFTKKELFVAGKQLEKLGFL